MNSPRMMDRVVTVSVDFHKPGTRRRMSTEDLNSDADKDLLRAAKIILESDTLNEIRSLHGKTRRFLKRKSLPALFKEGVFFVPTDLVPDVDERLVEAEAETRRLAKEFAKEYPSLIAAAKKRLRSEFNANDYMDPRGVETAFGVTWQYIEIAPSTRLKSISGAVYQRNLSKIEESRASAERTIQLLLRERFAKMIERITDRLSGQDDGTRKVFRDSLIDKATEFFNDFKALNVTDDRELEKLVNRAKGLLKGVDAETLRDDDKLREQVAGAFERIEAVTATMITDAPKRRIKVKEAA
jgi:Protein of unknown function (DUF3150)